MLHAGTVSAAPRVDLLLLRCTPATTDGLTAAKTSTAPTCVACAGAVSAVVAPLVNLLLLRCTAALHC